MTKWKTKALNYEQRRMCLRRGLNPANYRVLKNTNGVLYLLDLRYQKVKVIQKWK